MWSGCAGSRTFQQPGVACKGSLGGWQGGHRRRWSKPTVRQEITRRDHRGWSTHRTALRDKPAKPNQALNGNFVTSGEIGANAMHPPGKRSVYINNSHFRIGRCGRTQRSAPTRRYWNRHPQFNPSATPGGMWSGCHARPAVTIVET